MSDSNDETPCFANGATPKSYGSLFENDLTNPLNAVQAAMDPLIGRGISALAAGGGATLSPEVAAGILAAQQAAAGGTFADAAAFAASVGWVSEALPIAF
jgi:hypothetical protein